MNQIDIGLIERILNSQYQGQRLKDVVPISVFSREHLDGLRYELNETQKLIDYIKDQEKFQSAKDMISRIENIKPNFMMTARQINEIQEGLATGQIKTFREYYSYSPSTMKKVFIIVEFRGFHDDIDLLRLVFYYEKRHYIQNILLQFNASTTLQFIIEFGILDKKIGFLFNVEFEPLEGSVLSKANYFNVKIFIHTNMINSRIDMNSDTFLNLERLQRNKFLKDINYSNNIEIGGTYKFNYVIFRNLTLCNIHSISIFLDDQLINHILRLLLNNGRILTPEENLIYIIQNCPNNADLYIEQIIGYENVIDILMPIPEYHFFLHGYLNSLLEKPLVSEEIYYTLALLVLEQPDLDEEKKIAILKYLVLAEDYPGAQQLLTRLFFDFIGLGLGPNLTVSESIEDFYKIAKFLVNYKK